MTEKSRNNNESAISGAKMKTEELQSFHGKADESAKQVVGQDGA